MRTLTDIQRRVTHLDQLCFSWLSRWRTRRVVAKLIRAVSASGDGHCYALLALGLTVSIQTDWMYFLTLVAAFAIERPVYWLLKNAFKRDRPSSKDIPIAALLTAHDTFSFPSGHSCAAFLFATITAVYFPSLSMGLFCWAAAVAFSRVIVGVHYPTDVVAGSCLGMALGEFALLVVSI